MSTFKVQTRETKEAQIPIDYAKEHIAKWLGIDVKKTYISLDVNGSYFTVKWVESGTKEFPL